MIAKKKYMMLLSLMMLVLCMQLLTGCAGNKKISEPPQPIYGKDIIKLNAGEIAPFKGTLFSDKYLEDYLLFLDDYVNN